MCLCRAPAIGTSPISCGGGTNSRHVGTWLREEACGRAAFRIPRASWHSSTASSLNALARCHIYCGHIATHVVGRSVGQSRVVEDVIVPQPSLLKRVQQILGVHRLNSDRDLLKLVEDRVPT